MADGTALTKWADPDFTADGTRRAAVGLKQLETLWFNTGTLCNIECVNCYIESSPTNDRLVYLTPEDVAPYLAEAKEMGTREIGFTGGEPMMNKDIIRILEMTLEHGFDTLVLTNAMKPLMRPRVQEGLLDLKERFGSQLTLRISLDHYSKELHEKERGKDTYQPALDGMQWLAENGFTMTAAGRTCWGEDEAEARQGYQKVFEAIGVQIDVNDPEALVLFPEMNDGGDPPEITVECWGILNKKPSDIMCASSRMVVRHKGAGRAEVQACTLLAYDQQFNLGGSLKEASQPVKLNHPHCATFCVLGGGSCS
ncbi:MAG: radical SAM protein [Aquisalinus sp.]|nr:radical SAM protein [Aquisalinus sp.]